MHKEILTNKQIEFLSILKEFSKDFYLVGGTALALHLGHRKSIDFDLFSEKPIKRKQIKNIFEKHNLIIDNILFEDFEQIHFVVSGVKFTFMKFDYKILKFDLFENLIRIPTIFELAAMKAGALAGRGKWKDYVDLFFLLKFHFSLKDISKRAEELFGTYFSDKLFRQQLCYFKDINFEEEIEFMNNNNYSIQEIQDFLINSVTSDL